MSLAENASVTDPNRSVISYHQPSVILLLLLLLLLV